MFNLIKLHGISNFFFSFFFNSTIRHHSTSRKQANAFTTVQGKKFKSIPMALSQPTLSQSFQINIWAFLGNKFSAIHFGTTNITIRPCSKQWLVKDCLYMDPLSPIHQPQLAISRVVAFIVPKYVALDLFCFQYQFDSNHIK